MLYRNVFKMFTDRFLLTWTFLIMVFQTQEDDSPGKNVIYSFRWPRVANDLKKLDDLR